MSLADVDTIKVIGKGNGGIVQLVQHKWTGQFFALKVWLSAFPWLCFHLPYPLALCYNIMMLASLSCKMGIRI